MSANERIHEITSLMEGQRSLIRCTESDLADPARVTREIDRLEARILKDQQQVAIMRQRLEDGPSLIRQYKSRLKELARDLKLVENEKAIERLLELELQMKELNGECR